MNVVELKARAYDLLVIIETAQKELLEVNQRIQEAQATKIEE